jgi:hypothetical protein
MSRTLPTLALALLAATAANAEVTQCDQLASHPEDPDRIAPGVERAGMNLEAALAACEAEVARRPSDARTRYELARVLFYSGRNEQAIPQMKAAADAGYRQAQFVYGAMVSNHREHAPADMCVAERYWLASARAGRQAARISYVRHTLKGRFDGCPNRASRQELGELLATASVQAKDYYERLLVEDLQEKFESTGPRPASHR